MLTYKKIFASELRREKLIRRALLVGYVQQEEIKKPRTRCMHFSPVSFILLLLPYVRLAHATRTHARTHTQKKAPTGQIPSLWLVGWLVGWFLCLSAMSEGRGERHSTSTSAGWMLEVGKKKLVCSFVILVFTSRLIAQLHNWRGVFFVYLGHPVLGKSGETGRGR